jgi:hypothetical protein
MLLTVFPKKTSKTKVEDIRGIKEGYRSGLEERVAEQLASLGIEVEYESSKISYIKPQRSAKYTPDFHLPNGIIIETKGRFVTADRQKHLLIKEQHSTLDIRFVFSNSRTRISKTSPTTYAMWCNKYGFKFADKEIPLEWLKE